ncbi:MAG TPA: hypothetical protein VD766_04310 [Solirubrobacterales bacterium]|nr:hypothetical protein [Solirubrobacterales bacterium]
MPAVEVFETDGTPVGETKSDNQGRWEVDHDGGNTSYIAKAPKATKDGTVCKKGKSKPEAVEPAT